MLVWIVNQPIFVPCVQCFEVGHWDVLLLRPASNLQPVHARVWGGTEVDNEVNVGRLSFHQPVEPLLVDFVLEVIDEGWVAFTQILDKAMPVQHDKEQKEEQKEREKKREREEEEEDEIIK